MQYRVLPPCPARQAGGQAHRTAFECPARRATNAADAWCASRLESWWLSWSPDDQLHRSCAVNLAAVGHVMHMENGTGVIHLHGRVPTRPVSRSRLHLLQQR